MAISIVLMMCRFFLFLRVVAILNILRVLEDFISIIMTDSTGFLLVYFSVYFSLILDQLKTTIENIIEEKEDFSKIDEWLITIAKIQKQIKIANNLLSPCLINIFSFSILFIIIFWSLIHSLVDYNSNFSIRTLWPLIAIYVIRLFIWCLFADNMNQKVLKFDLIYN